MMAGASERPTRFRFGTFTLVPTERSLLNGDRPVAITPKAFDLLACFAANPGRLLTKDELLQAVWPDAVVEESNLAYHVSTLRKVLGEGTQADRFIETVPKGGYRFVAPVVRLDDTDAAGPLTPVPPHRGSWRAAVLAATIIVLIVTITAVRSKSKPPGAAPWAATPIQLTFEDGLQTDPSFSPDGRTIVYAGNASGQFDLYTLPVDGGPPVAIVPHPAHDSQPDWSIDGQIAFRSERDGGGIFVVPASGGVARPVVKFGYRPQWSPDGKALLFMRSTITGTNPGLTAVTWPDGVPHELARTGSGAYGWTRDSQRVLVLSSLSAFIPQLTEIDVATGTPTEWTTDAAVEQRLRAADLMVPAGRKLQWDRDGRSLFFVGVSHGAHAVWRIDVDVTARRVIGGPIRITALPNANTFSLSRTGDRIAFDGSPRAAQLWSYALDAAGHVLEDTRRSESPGAAHSDQPSLSADGAWLAFVQTLPGGRNSRALVVRDMATGREETFRKASDETESFVLPRLNHDGTRLAYTLLTGQAPGAVQHQIRVLDLASRRDEPLTTLSSSHAIQFASGWSPDDRFVVAIGPYDRGRASIGLLPVGRAPRAEQSAVVVTSAEKDTLYQAAMSPDGEWIAFRAVPSAGQPGTRLAIVSVKGGDQSKWIVVDTPANDKPRWSPTGDRLYVTRHNGAMLNVWSIGFDRAKGRVVGVPRQETHFTDPALHLLPDIRELELGVGGHSLVVPVVQAAGGIWLAERGGS